MVTYKTKAERAQEAVQVLAYLRKQEVRVADPGYKKTKVLLDSWIQSGDPSSHTYECPLAKKSCILELPSRVERPVQITLTTL